MTFLEAPQQAQQFLQLPGQITDQCNMLGKPVQGNAAGHTGADVDDLSGLTFGPFQQNLGWHSRGELLALPHLFC